MSYKTPIYKKNALTNSVKLPLSYWLLVGLRVLLSLLPQTGYLHPDEYFQNIEVIAGDVFDVEVARTWEFDVRFPIRSIFMPKLIFGPPFHFIRLINPYTKTYLNLDLKTPYFLLVIPRLVICLLSFINDYCLYRICVIYGQNFKTRLKVFASSYVVIVYCCRCFSNTFETILFSVLLLLVAESMHKSDKVIYHDEYLRARYDQAKDPVEKVKIFKLQSLLPYHSLRYVFFIAIVVVLGTFNRPTFVAFAFPPMFFWLQRGLGSKVVGFKDFNLRIFLLILSGLPIVLFLILVDSFYYGYLTLAEVHSMILSWNNWVVTPWNFVRYNVDTNNLARHGLHPHWLHLVANFPLLFNVLAGFATFSLGVYLLRFIRGQYVKLPRFQSITGLMIFSLFTPIALLSIFPHQEARFIIPVIQPLVYLYGNNLYPNDCDNKTSLRFKRFLLYTWYFINLLMTIFFGFIHQGGMYGFTRDLHYEIKSQYGVRTYVITTHSYSVPTFMLQLESTSKTWRNKATGKRYKVAKSTFIHKYGSLPTQALFEHIDELLTEAEQNLYEANKKYRLYIAAPCSLDEEIDSVSRNYHYFELMPEFKYYPHYCHEALPKFPDKHDQYCVDGFRLSTNESRAVNLNMLERISCYVQRFCYKVYKVKTVNVKTTVK